MQTLPPELLTAARHTVGAMLDALRDLQVALDEVHGVPVAGESSAA